MANQMELSNADLIGLLNATRAMKGTKESLPIKVWYGLNKNEKVLTEQITHFEEARIQLAMQHAKKHESGGEQKLKNGQILKYAVGDSMKDDNGNFIISDMKLFNDELSTILLEKVNIELHKIKYSDLKDIRVSTEENPFIGLFLECCVEMDE